MPPSPMAEHRSDSEPESDIDAETLQARIDMSMAYAQDIVSGWMNASGTYASSSIPLNGSGSSGKKRDVEKELEEMMKRPPRLGVGATVPDSAGPSGREVAQLKNKLTGQKRRRDTRDADLDTKTNGVANSRNKSEDSDEEESRVTAIRKKAKVDPFEKKTKKKKKKEMDGSGAVNANEDPTMVSGKGKENEKAEQIVTNLFDVPSFGTDKMENGEEDKMDVDAGGSFLRDGVIESGQGGDQKPGDGGGLGEGKKRKKRKKKHRDGEVRGTTTNSGEGSQTDGLVLGKSNAAGTVHISSLTSRPPDPTEPSLSCSDPPLPPQTPSPMSVGSPFKDQSPSINGAATSILNLTGPPPEVREAAESGTKKKKKRNKKKKKKGLSLNGAPDGDLEQRDIEQPPDDIDDE